MAHYVYLEKIGNRGKMGISSQVFNVLVENSIHRVEGCSPSNKRLPASYKFRLRKHAVRTIIHRGIVHVLVFVDVKKGAKIQEVTRNIEDEINTTLLTATETVPFDVQIRVETIVE